MRPETRRQSCAALVFATCSCQLQPPQKFLNYAHICSASLPVFVLLFLSLSFCCCSCCCLLAAPEMVFGRKCYTQRAASRMARTMACDDSKGREVGSWLCHGGRNKLQTLVMPQFTTLSVYDATAQHVAAAAVIACLPSPAIYVFLLVSIYLCICLFSLHLMNKVSNCKYCGHALPLCASVYFQDQQCSLLHVQHTPSICQFLGLSVPHDGPASITPTTSRPETPTPPSSTPSTPMGKPTNNSAASTAAPTMEAAVDARPATVPSPTGSVGSKCSCSQAPFGCVLTHLITSFLFCSHSGNYPVSDILCGLRGHVRLLPCPQAARATSLPAQQLGGSLLCGNLQLNYQIRLQADPNSLIFLTMQTTQLVY